MMPMIAGPPYAVNPSFRNCAAISRQRVTNVSGCMRRLPSSPSASGAPGARHVLTPRMTRSLNAIILMGRFSRACVVMLRLLFRTV
jgi:hypothetical protein